MYEYQKPNQVLGFDPRFDREPVNQTGVIDLHAVAVSGSIPGDIIIEEEAFNGVADPSSLMTRPKDRFEKMRQFKYVKESLKAAKANAEAGQPSEAATN